MPGGPPSKISQAELKKLIQNLGRDVEFSGPADEATKKVLRPTWNALSKIVKENDQYRELVAPAKKLIDTADELESALSLERGAGHEINITDRTAGAIKSIIRGNKTVSEDTVKKVGLSDILSAARNRAEQGKAKDTAIKEAMSGMKDKFPSEAKIKTMAEAAARQGPGSGAHTRLVESLTSVLGPQEAEKVAKEIMTAAAKEIMSRGGGSTFTGLNVMGLIASPLRRVGTENLRVFDSALKVPISIGGALSKLSNAIPTRGAGAVSYPMTLGLTKKNIKEKTQ
jgi:hypothetical protein